MISCLRTRRVSLSWLTVGAFFCCTSAATSQTPVTFADVSSTAGIGDALRQAFSVSWVDFNNDGLPDIWLSRHTYEGDNATPALFINNGNGQFNDIGATVWPWGPGTLPRCNGGARCIDAHGSSWIDYDNDGDQDLFIPVGDNNSRSQNPSLLLVNENGKLVDRAAAVGIDDPAQRGRASLWYDWNKDGLLDAYVLAPPRTDGIVAPSELFENHITRFDPVSAAAGLHDAEVSAQYAQLADVNGDSHPDVVVHADSLQGTPTRVYDTSTRPFTDITATFPRTRQVRDTAIVPLDDDLYPDIFMLRNEPVVGGKSRVYQQGPRLAGFFLTAQSGEVGFSLKTTGNLIFDVRDYAGVYPRAANVFIGSGGRHPSGFPVTIASSDATAAGIAPHIPGNAQAIYVGYEQATQTWRVLVSSSPQVSPFSLWMRVQTTANFTELTPIGGNFAAPAAYAPVLLTYDKATGRYKDKTVAAGLSRPLTGNSVAAADFNNDGFVDLFIDGGDAIKKTPNTLYLNKGDGTFIQQAGAGGADGPNVGPHNTSNELELGSKVAIADYDRDGFIDVLTTNTLFRNMRYDYYAVAPNRLYRNLGNGNHWVELDLEGTQSNRNGIGARVLLTAGGRTQLREQQGGMHAFAQDSQRIHFGLGQATTIDSIVVEWPSGVRQTLTSLSAVDRSYLIREP